VTGPVAGVVLAAGLSRRMGKRNKLVAEIDGKPMVRRVVETALAAGLDRVVVVIGHGAADVRAALDGLPVTFAENVRPEAGLSSSLRVGLRAVEGGDPPVAAAVVLLGDMPWVEAGDVRALVAAFDPASGCEICVPVHEGRRGNPVLWDRRFIAEMTALQGDVGARALLERHGERVREVPVAGVGVLRDVDTSDALTAAVASRS
jgi:molybdenum cofactor cytidylyltransferase